MASTRTLGESLHRWADKHGVETFVAVVKNPDDTEVVAVRRGDACWQVGALKLIDQEVVDNWIEIQGEEDEP